MTTTLTKPKRKPREWPPDKRRCRFMVDEEKRCPQFTTDHFCYFHTKVELGLITARGAK